MMDTICIDVRFDGGKVRVKKHTGVTDRRTANDMRSMLRLLWRQPAHRQLVIDIAQNRRSLFDVYASYINGRLADLTPAFEDQELEPLRDAWLADFQVSASHKARCKQALEALTKTVKHAVKVSELPALLEEYRSRCLKKNTPRAFNYAKQACLALIRDKIGRRHPLRNLVADVPGMTERKEGVLGITVEEARAVRQRLAAIELHPDGQTTPDRSMGEQAARIWWAMCCTGMGATEYWGEWTVLSDRVRIRGTKRPGRRWGTVGREVPLVVTLLRPEMTPDRFAKLLKKAGASPYQGRHSFGCWMEDAEIPRTRREMYLGHGVKDVTAKYERREITRFLEEDRARLLKVLGTEPTLQLMRTHGLVVGQMAQEA